jgi:hypothetical protein
MMPRPAKPTIPFGDTEGGGMASSVVADSEPKSGSLFCFFFLQKKEALAFLPEPQAA